MLPVAVIAELSSTAFEDCGEKMRMLLATGMVLEEPLIVKSENFIRKASSVSGTVRCMTHSKPCKKVSSAVAVLCTVSTLVTASGVEDAVELVVNTASDDVAVPPESVELTT